MPRSAPSPSSRRCYWLVDEGPLTLEKSAARAELHAAGEHGIHYRDAHHASAELLDSSYWP